MVMEPAPAESPAEEDPNAENPESKPPASSSADEALNGVIWKADGLDDAVTLTFRTEQSDDSGMHIKIYLKYNPSESGDKHLTNVCELLIEGSGSASARLPAGVYTFKIGTGTDWQGSTDSFGSEGRYGILYVDKASTEMSLLPGIPYTINVDMQKSPGFFGIGVESISYDEF